MPKKSLFRIWASTLLALIAAMPPGAVAGELHLRQNTDHGRLVEQMAGHDDWTLIVNHSVGAHMTGAWFEEIARCADLRTLSLRSARVDFADADLARLAACRELVKLRLDVPPEIGDEALEAIAQGCPELEELELNGARGITTAGVKTLAASCPKLREVILETVPETGDDALGALIKGCPNLEKLNLSGAAKLTDNGFAGWAGKGAAKLTHLWLDGSPAIGDGALAHLSGASKLSVLYLRGTEHITDAGLTHLSKCPRLMNLLLPDAKAVTPEGSIRALAGCKELYWLWLPGDGWDDAGAASVVDALPRLGFLRLDRAVRIGDETLRAIGRKGVTKRVILPMAADITDAGLAALGRSIGFATIPSAEHITYAALRRFARDEQNADLLLPLPADWAEPDETLFPPPDSPLRFLHIQDWRAPPPWLRGHNIVPWVVYNDIADATQPLGPDDVAAFAANPELRRVSIGRKLHHAIRDSDVALFAQCPELLELCFPHTQPVTAATLELIARNCPDLLVLELRVALSDPAEADAAFAALGGLGRLRELTIWSDGGIAVGDEGLLALAAGCPDLVKLRAGGGRRVTADGLEGLALACPRLVELSLGVSPLVGDASVEAICADRPGLVSLSLDGAEGVTDKSVLRLADLLELESVGFSDSRDITDASLTALLGLSVLRGIGFPVARGITDKGLRALADGCPALFTLDIRNAPGLTPEGVADFRKRRPRVVVFEPKPQPTTPPPPPAPIVDIF